MDEYVKKYEGGKLMDELVKRLRASCDSCKLWDGYKCCLNGECTAQTRLQAADAMEELYARADTAEGMLAEQPPAWIPVTERLPEMLVNVIVTDGKHVGMAWRDWYEDRVTKMQNEYWCAPNSEVNEEHITHWMPLPEPPKEE